MSWHRIALIAYCVIVAAGLILLGFQEADTKRRLGPVGVVGPCREFGPENLECRRQSRKIIRSCLTHQDCLALIERLIHRARRQGLTPDDQVSQHETQGGGNSNTGSAPPSQPDPPSTGGGSPGNDGGGSPPNQPPVGNPPTTPPAPPPDPLQSVTDTACSATGQLGVSLPVC